MDELTYIAEVNGGYLMRHQLNDLGYDDTAIRQAMRAGVLKRVRHGTYVVKRVWDLLSASQRHAVLVRSVLDKLGPHVVASHQSAAALHGIDLYDVDLSTIHVTRLDGHRGRTEAGIVFHEGRIGDDDIVPVDGRAATEPVRAVFEACSLSGVESGMVMASSAMRTAGMTREELEEHCLRFAHWPGSRTARLAIRLSDHRLESVGEVRSLYMMWRNHIPYPELQWSVVTADGVTVARTDFAWIDACHTGEFDGLVKYGRLNPYAADPGRTIEDEKVREDSVRAESLGMSRWIWVDLAPLRQRRTAARIRDGMELSRKLYRRNRTTIV